MSLVQKGHEVVHAIRRLGDGLQLETSGETYHMNDEGELCFTDRDGSEVVSGITFNEFVRKVTS